MSYKLRRPVARIRITHIPRVASDPSGHCSHVVERPVTLLQLIKKSAQPKFFQQVFSDIHLDIEAIEIVECNPHLRIF